MQFEIVLNGWAFPSCHMGQCVSVCTVSVGYDHVFTCHGHACWVVSWSFTQHSATCHSGCTSFCVSVCVNLVTPEHVYQTNLWCFESYVNIKNSLNNHCYSGFELLFKSRRHSRLLNRRGPKRIGRGTSHDIALFFCLFVCSPFSQVPMFSCMTLYICSWEFFCFKSMKSRKVTPVTGAVLP